jgi:E1-E2 ATPase/Cation transporter/ATPase, N-terminus
MMTMPTALLVVVIRMMMRMMTVVVPAQAEFGDFVDPTYNCPATITCPRVCVVTADDCPAITQCSGSNATTTLCVDGTCAPPPGKACPDGLTSPCPYDCAKIACPRHVDAQDTCDVLFGGYYAAEATCGAAETVAETSYVTFREPAYRLTYAWVMCITIGTMIWCAYNQRWSPVPGSTKPLQHVAVAADNNNNNNNNNNSRNDMMHGTRVAAVCQHSGYQRHGIGLLLHYLTLLTFCGWNALLCWLSIQYYAMDGNEYVSKRNVVIEDEEQLLKTYIITWSVGLVWCLVMLKWPHSVRSVFLRRCRLSQASFVAVYLELPQAADNVKYRNNNNNNSVYCPPGCLEWVKKVLDCIFRFLNSIASIFIFSDKDCFHQKDGSAVFKYCRVQTDNDDMGTRYFMFLFRRYNYDASTDSFVPGVFIVGDRLGDYVAAGTSGGLTSDQVMERTSIVGPNTIETKTPSFLYTLVQELNKPFYMYQLFMIWSWMPLYYYYMALVWAVVISTSALTVSYFQYKNQVNVHRITQMEGQSTVRRNGDYVQVDHQDLVPGDVVQLEPGMDFCDFVVIQGQATLVDESALTGEAAPQAKAPIDPQEGDQMLDPRIVHRRHMISAGTCILESQHGVAVVMNTGSFTAKGDLLREMFSFRRYQLKFDYEVPIVIAILIIYAIIGFNIVVAFIEASPVYGWFYGM